MPPLDFHADYRLGYLQPEPFANQAEQLDSPQKP